MSAAQIDGGLPGDECAGYSLRRLIGRGGFSEVYEALAPDGGRAAVKVALDPVDSRLSREAVALARLGAPTTPALLAQGRMRDGRAFLAMTLVDAPTLETFVATHDGALSPALAARIVASIAEALERVHQAGLVHRDLKPANVLWADRATLVDFGLAWVPDQARITATGDAPGTPAFMAPEQIEGSASAASDVYALGCMAYQLLTGRPIFVGSPAELLAAHVMQRPTPPSEVAPWLAAAVDPPLLAALAKRPEARPSARELARALGDAAARCSEPSAAVRPDRSSGVRSGAVPVALLGVRGDTVVAALQAAVAPEQGTLVRQQHDLTLFAFVREDLTGAVGSASAAGQALVEMFPGLAVTVHVAPLHVRLRGDRAFVLGPALDDPEWCAGEPGALEVSSEARPHITTLPTPAFLRPPLVGREAIVESVLDAAQAGPALFTVLGGSGLGKTRLCEELVVALASAGRPAKLVAGADLRARLERRCGRALPTGRRRERARHLARALMGPEVLLVDDAHLADPAALDALELAAAAEDGPFVLLAASPALAEARPLLGAHVPSFHAHSLGPLAGRHLAALWLACLAPVEHVPRSVLAHLVTHCGGNPATVVQLAGALHAAGAVRRQGGGHVLASEVVLAVGGGALAPRLAERALAQVPDPLWPLAQAAAVLDAPFDAATVGMLADHVRDSGPGVDPEAGLTRLARLGLVVRQGAGFVFGHPCYAGAIQARTPPRRLAALHAAALECCEATGAAPLDRIARHAGGAGDRERALATWLEVADRAARACRWIDVLGGLAEALPLMERGDPRWRPAVTLRARASLFLQRFSEALRDLADARAATRCPIELAELWLLEAMLLDWRDDFSRAESATWQACALAADTVNPGLHARCALSRGNVARRKGHNDVARSELELAATSGDRETRAIALTVLGAIASDLGDSAAGRAHLDQAISLCREAGDTCHLAGAYATRAFAWPDDPARALEDAQVAVELAAELGHAQLERVAAHMAGSLLLHVGRPDDALVHARRALRLGARIGSEEPLFYDALLLARIQAARGEVREAGECLDWLAHNCPIATWPSGDRFVGRAVTLCVAEARLEDWRALLAEVCSASPTEISPIERAEVERLALARGA